jgi:hypothetical protein
MLILMPLLTTLREVLHRLVDNTSLRWLLDMAMEANLKVKWEAVKLMLLQKPLREKASLMSLIALVTCSFIR